MYLVMPDRFANGDPANDDPARARGLLDRSEDPLLPRRRPQGPRRPAALPQDLGVTALWLNPWYDNANHLNEKETYDDQPITDYHGYGAVDFYAVDEHLGDLASLRELVDAAHARGIKVIQDQVANHSGPYHPWVEGLADAHLVQRHRGPAPRQHLADLDAPRSEGDAPTSRRPRSTAGSSTSFPT